jgi:hypothetical protein
MNESRMARLEGQVRELVPDRPVVFVHKPTPPGLTREEYAAWSRQEQARAAQEGTVVFTMRIPSAPNFGNEESGDV